MNISVSNLEAIQRAVEKRINAIGGSLEQAVQVERDAIETRTKQGIDVNGSPFEKYSESKKWNWRDVRIKNEKQVAYVDLSFSGDMFEALKTVVKRSGFKFLATIFFDDRKQAQKAKGHHTGKLGRTTYEPRKFFALSQSQREAIISKIRNAK